MVKEMADFREYKEEYRFQLDRRPGRSRLKLDCPKCGKKRCFTPYVDITTGEVVSPEFGRCDHERTCGFHNPPKMNGMDLWVNRNDVKPGFLKPKVGEIVNEIPFGEFMKTVKPCRENTLFRFLASLWDERLVESVFRRYFVGTMDLWSWKGCPVFWQIDKNFHCRTGKIMDYEIRKREDGKPVDVKRVKEGEDERPHVMFYHSLIGRDYLMQQCLFGEHLLNMFPDGQTVNIVESEKTAIICSINKPSELFLATGGLQNFRPEVMDTIKGRRIVAFPDKGSAADVWKKKIAENLPYHGIKVSEYLNAVDSVGDGGDIADMIINNKVAEVYGRNN